MELSRAGGTGNPCKRRIRAGKRGILFTLIALLLASMFIVVFTTQVQTPLDHKTPLIDMKVNNLKIYNSHLEAYTRSALAIASYDALRAMGDMLVKSHREFMNLSEVECVFADYVVDGRSRLINAAPAAVGPDEKDLMFRINDSNPATAEEIASNMEDDPLDWVEVLQINRSEPNLTFAAYQKFKAIKNDRLVKVEFIAEVEPNAPEAVITAEVYSDYCNMPTSLIERSAAVPIIPGDTTRFDVATFSGDKTLYAGHEYLVMVYGSEHFNLSFNEPDPRPPELGNEYAMNATILENYSDFTLTNHTSLEAWLSKIITTSHGELGIDTNYTIGDVHLYQNYPWTLTVEAGFTFFTNDSVSSFMNNVSLRANFDIDGLYDPLYIYHGLGENRIYRSAFGIDTGFNISPVSEFASRQEYWQNRMAPSYLDRLWNNTNASYFGIESIMNLTKLKIRGIDFERSFNTSFIDYIYLNGSNVSCLNLFTINSTQVSQDLPGSIAEDFWDTLDYNKTSYDRDHLQIYNISTVYWINSPCIP